MRALWFDTTVRGLPVSSPRTGWGSAKVRGGLPWGVGAGAVWFPSTGSGQALRASEGLRLGSPRTGAGDCHGGLGAVGFVVRHDRPRTPGRLTTNGGGRAVFGGGRGRFANRLYGKWARHEQGWLRGRGRLETGPYVRSGRRDSGGMKARSLGGPRDDKRRRAGGRRGLYGLGGGSGGGGFGLGLGAVPLLVAVSSRA